MKGILYLVATPIGNLQDITLRAINILNEVDIIAAEDTRHTLKLLNHLKISKPLISYHRHNEEIKSEMLINKILEGNNIALVSDAGTPAISDPGEGIVKEAIKNDIEIVPIPGSCAAITALIASGMDTNEFTFMGFLPLNKKLRKNKLEEIKNSKKTLIIYEAPHKLLNTLEELKEIIGNRRITVAKELTKIHEKFYRGSIDEVLSLIQNPKGEYIVLIQGATDVETKKEFFEDMTLEEHYSYYENNGYTKKEIIKQIAKDRKVSKNDIYKMFINKKE